MSHSPKVDTSVISHRWNLSISPIPCTSIPCLQFLTGSEQNVWLAEKDAHSITQQNNCQHSRCFVKADHVLLYLQTAVQLTCVSEILACKLTHKLGTACDIEMAVDMDEWSELPSGATTVTWGQGHWSSGGQDFLNGLEHSGLNQWCMVQAHHQLIAARYCCKDGGLNTMTVRGCRTKPLLMMVIHSTHKQEWSMHIFSLHVSHWC